MIVPAIAASLRITALTFCIVSALCLGTAAAAQECGDLDGNGTVVSSDALRLLRFSVGQQVAIQCPGALHCWDTNASNVCDAAEDKTGDQSCSVDDCQGPKGDPGEAGPPGQDAPVPECGDGQAGTGEACDELDLNSQTCQSAGFLYGTLACSACALDTTECTNARYRDNGDGTVTDHQTKLMWEKKTGVPGSPSVCPAGPTCGSVHDVNNAYAWSGGNAPPYGPDGPAYFAFLAELNGLSPLAGHDDWRLPTITELQGILDLSVDGCGWEIPCIDPVFGPTQASFYWSSTTTHDDPTGARMVYFSGAGTGIGGKLAPLHVRAVRSGS